MEDEKGITSETIRAAIAAWMRFDRQCPIVSFERGPVSGLPDIVAVTSSRLLWEVEIKTSISDLRADFQKDKWRLRKHGYRVPHYFTFAFHPSILAKAEEILKTEMPSAGILTLFDGYRPHPITGLPCVRVVKASRRNKEGVRVSPRDLVEMVRGQSATLISLACKAAKKSHK